MNLPNKITMARIVLSILLIIFLIFPFDLCGVTFPTYVWFGKITISLQYIIGGVVFLYLLQPLFEKLTDKLGEDRTKTIACVLGTIVVIDMIYTFLIK